MENLHTPRPPGLCVVVGGVGELFQADLDLGRVVVERLQEEELPGCVVVEDFHYGAIAVTQRLEELRPDVLVIVAATQRGRPPGTVERRRIADLDLDVATFQVAVGDAGTGYVTADLLIEVAWGFEALPARTILIDVEPAVVGPDPNLSPTALSAMEEVLAHVHREIRMAPLFDLVALIRESLAIHEAGSTATAALCDLLAQLDILDREGRWGRTFAEKDRLQLAIAEGATGETMTHADWGMWWGLIEEIERLEHLSVVDID